MAEKFAPVVINGVRFTGKQHEALVNAAIESASNLGYCSESENVLEEMGLTVPSNEVVVTLKVRVSNLDRNIEADNQYNWNVEFTADWDADLDLMSVTLD